MTVYLRQSTASQEIALGHFVDATDGVTAEDGLTIANTDIKLWKNAATSLANKNSGGATHMAQGVYSAALDATDTATAGPLIIFVAVAGALPVRLECCVLPAQVFDSLVLGSDLLQVDLTQIAGAAVSTSTAQLGVNVVSMATDSVSAAALAAGAVTEIQSGLATASALATVDTEVDAIRAKTDNLPPDPADASVIAAATGAILSAVGTVDGIVDTIVATTNKLDDTLEDDGGTYRFTAAALAEGPAGGGGGGGATAEEVWEYATRTLTAGVAVSSIANDAITAASIAAGAVTELQSGLATAAALTTVGNAAAAIQAKTDNLPPDPADASVVAAATGAILTAVGVVDGKVDTVDTVVDGIKGVTDQLTASQAELTGVPAADASPLAKINRLHAAAFNGLRIEGTTKAFLDKDGAQAYKATVSEAAGVYTQTRVTTI